MVPLFESLLHGMEEIQKREQEVVGGVRSESEGAGKGEM